MHNQNNKNIRNNTVLIERLNDVTQKLVDGFEPLEIILYGSYARGDYTEFSEIDLIVIIENTNMRFQDRSIRALSLVTSSDPVKDIPILPIVYTSKEFKTMLDSKDSFLVSALRESILLWKRQKEWNIGIQLDSNLEESEFKKLLPKD